MSNELRAALEAADAEHERAGMPDAVDARVRARLRAGRVQRPGARVWPIGLVLSGAAALVLVVGSSHYGRVVRDTARGMAPPAAEQPAPTVTTSPSGATAEANGVLGLLKKQEGGSVGSIFEEAPVDTPAHAADPSAQPRTTAGLDEVSGGAKTKASRHAIGDSVLPDGDGRPDTGGEALRAGAYWRELRNKDGKSGDLGLFGRGRGGGGTGEGTIGLGGLGTVGRGSGTGAGYGYGGFVATAAGPPPRMYLDPEGRFATTYRPGGGSFARFHEALARGHAPPRALQLAADFGGRYGEPLAAPTEIALALRADAERNALPPAGGPVHLRLRLRGAESLPTARPVIAATLIIDVSGSMSGEPIQKAREAARQMVERLEPSDRVAIVTYETGARVVVPEGPVGGRKAAILRAIDRIEPQGSTNLEAGLAAGYAQARRAPDRADVVRLAIVFSDGQANVGNTDPWQLSARAARAFHDGIETTTVGIGASYDPRQMTMLSEHGGGGYYYVRDLASIAGILAQEVELRAQPVARAVELRVRLAPGVRLVQTYGSRRLGEAEAARVRSSEVAIDQRSVRHDRIRADRQVDAHGGMRFFIPGFARADAHTMLLELEAPPGHGDQALATVELRYKDRVRGTNHIEEQVVRVGTAPSAEASAATESPSVARTVLGFRTGMSLLGASGNRHASWAARLAERAQLLRAAAARWNDPTLGRDAELLDQYASVLGSGELSRDPIVLSLLLDRAAYQLLH